MKSSKKLIYHGIPLQLKNYQQFMKLRFKIFYLPVFRPMSVMNNIFLLRLKVEQYFVHVHGQKETFPVRLYSINCFLLRILYTVKQCATTSGSIIHLNMFGSDTTSTTFDKVQYFLKTPRLCHIGNVSRTQNLNPSYFPARARYHLFNFWIVHKPFPSWYFLHFL